jgi:putative membrane-bound dehydrogenase-like protein
VEREDGGRGFGFTGGHFHMNWGDDNFRKVVLNALLWISKVEVPAGGVASSVTEEELMENLDPKRGSRPAVRPSADAGAKPLFRSGLIKSGSVPVDVDLTGAEGLWLVVADAGDGIGCDWADWAEPVLVKQDGSKVKLTDVKWKSATTGHGRVNIDRNCGGGSLKIAGEPVSFGIGTHAPSVIEYDLAGQGFVRFKGRAGVDNGGTDQGCGSSVEFMAFVQPPPRSVVFASAAAAGSGGGRGSGPEAAKEYLKTMTVPEGLEVTLFASEPMLRNPTNMDIDSRGRIWVTEGVNYRSTFQSWGVLREGGDRILILEDTNGDGTADKETIFYQGPEINAALGICVLGNRVIVSRSPDIFVFTDTNGDDRADRKDVWFSGIGGVDHDHGAHAFVFGPDGRLYFNVGNDGGRLKTADGNRYVVDRAGNEVHGHGNPYRQGLVFRCNLQGGELETLAWNFRNNYEVAVDSFGTMWQSDNDDDGNQAVRINYVMEFGNYGFTDEMTGAGWRTQRTNMEDAIPQQHWHQNDPGVMPNLLVTGAGSPTGITVYEGRLLPRVFHDQMLHCDAGPRVVRAYPVTSSGAGYEATVVNLLESSDTWFRPSDVSVAPDGSVYVADWNDPGVGGHNMGDRNLETMRGRIYRVAPAGHQSRVGKPDLESAEGAVTALKSPNSATRFLAWTALHRLGDQAETALIRLWNDDNPRMRARALHLLARIPGKERKYIAEALKDPDSDIRITGLRIARERRYDMIPYVRMLVDDPSPQVRRECALALRHHSAPEAAGLWARLAVQHDGADRWYLEALGIGADRQWDRYLDEWLEQVGDDWNTPAGRDVVWRSRSKKTPDLLVKIIADGNTSREERSRYIRSLDFIKGPEKDAALIQLLGVN